MRPSADASGTMLPAQEGTIKEAIGSGENGFRVEVSLKYRRLLVQQLAKETLISAKDYEGFRSATAACAAVRFVDAWIMCYV